MRMPSKLLNSLAMFYKLPYENVLVNTTHQEFIEMTIEDMVALASIPDLGSRAVDVAAAMDWIFTQIVFLEEDV